jgi:DTW domain-containing protein YfiP
MKEIQQKSGDKVEETTKPFRAMPNHPGAECDRCSDLSNVCISRIRPSLRQFGGG